MLKSTYGCNDFFYFSSVCLSQERRSLTVTPNDLALVTLFMGLFSILIFMWLFVFVSCFWRELIIINSVFAIFKLRRLACIRWLRFLSSVLIKLWSSLVVPATKVIFVSSANILGEPTLRQLGRLLM